MTLKEQIIIMDEFIKQIHPEFQFEWAGGPATGSDPNSLSDDFNSYEFWWFVGDEDEVIFEIDPVKEMSEWMFYIYGKCVAKDGKLEVADPDIIKKTRMLIKEYGI